MRKLMTALLVCLAYPGVVLGQTDSFLYADAPSAPPDGGGFPVSCRGGVTYYVDGDPRHVELAIWILDPNGRELASWSGAATGSIEHELAYLIPWSEAIDGVYSCFSQPVPGYQRVVQFRPRVPNDLRSVPPDEFWYWGYGNYLRERVWEVWDFTGPWTYGNMPVAESFFTHTNECNIRFDIATTSTNSSGRFLDRYGNYDGLSTIPACLNPAYRDCRTITTQTITVVGFSFPHQVEWTCYDVFIGRP